MTAATAETRGQAATRRKASGGRCSLTLRINGERYTVRPLDGRGVGARRAWRLRKLSDGRVYDVADVSTGAECDCADHVFRREGIDPRGCKHVRALRALGLLAPARQRG